jgi:hypothetical protein
VSVLDDESLERFREAPWELTGLIRIFLRRPGVDEAEPQGLTPGSTVVDAAHTVHHELAATCVGARVSGPSAKFDDQGVGRDHVLDDADMVEIVQPARRPPGCGRRAAIGSSALNSRSSPRSTEGWPSSCAEGGQGPIRRHGCAV